MPLNHEIPFRDRFVRRELVDPEQLFKHPLNWRIHPPSQEAHVATSLETIGWFDEVHCQDGTNVIFDGHLRVLLALKRHEAEVPVNYYDLSDDELAQALALKDATAALAVADKHQLDTLLRSTSPHSEEMARLIADLRTENGLAAPLVDFREYDTDIADGMGAGAGAGVSMGSSSNAASADGEPRELVCPHCGESFTP